MKVWITKWAIGTGVIVVDSECRKIDEIKIAVDWPTLATQYFYRPDWHETEAEALARVEQMVNAKSQALHNQLTRLGRIRQQCGIGKLPMAKERAKE